MSDEDIQLAEEPAGRGQCALDAVVASRFGTGGRGGASDIPHEVYARIEATRDGFVGVDLTTQATPARAGDKSGGHWRPEDRF
jgi:hypothetical protein